MTIVEPDSILEDNGRTYHGYKQGSQYSFYLRASAMADHGSTQGIFCPTTE